MQKLFKFIKNPFLLFETLGHRELLNWISDERYLKILYRIRIGKKLNINAPKTYNEKLQWLKINSKNPEYTSLVDKFEVKRYVENIIGKQYIIPTLGVWNSFDEINFDKLPNQFVLKCTHDSGGLVVVKDKKTLDIDAARKKIEKSIKHNYFWGGARIPL